MEKVLSMTNQLVYLLPSPCSIVEFCIQDVSMSATLLYLMIHLDRLMMMLSYLIHQLFVHLHVMSTTLIGMWINHPWLYHNLLNHSVPLPLLLQDVANIALLTQVLLRSTEWALLMTDPDTFLPWQKMTPDPMKLKH